jgi:hypothetical protein
MGQVSTSGIGSLGHGGITKPIAGQVITSGQGVLDDQRGQFFFTGQGSLAPRLTPTGITGQSINSAQGTITPAPQGTGDVTVHLNADEQFIRSFVGTVSPITVPSGQASTSAAGVVVPLYTRDLVGESFTASIGVLAPVLDAEDTYIGSLSGLPSVSQDCALTGEATTFDLGTLSSSALDKEAELLGLELVSGQTSIEGTISADLVVIGDELNTLITSSQSNLGAPGGAALTGAEVLVEQGFFGRDLEISGAEITSAQGSVEGLPGIVALLGEEVSLHQGILTSDRPSTQWTPESAPTTPWTPTSGPASSWTKRSDPSTPWTRKT